MMRWGTSDQCIKVSVALIAASLGFRALPSATVLFVTAFIAGLGVAAVQVILPSVIKERFENSATVTSLYATIMNVSAGLATGLTAWIAASLGSWRLGLAIWAILAVFGLCIWAFSSRERAARIPTQADRLIEFNNVWCDQTAWRISLFAGSGSLIFWSVTTWLPSIYIASGWDQAAAGLLASELAFVQVVASFAVTALTGWGMSLLVMRLIGIAAGIIGLLILAWAPDRASWPCILLLGSSIGSLFTLAIMMPVEMGISQRHVQLLTAMSLSVGYLVASIGPVAIGTIRDLSGGFQVPFTSLALVFGILGLIGAQPIRRK
jgi:CP family cyanate transporter-like MFS transporter